MLEAVKKFRRNCTRATAVEYGLVTAVVSASAVAALIGIGGSLQRVADFVPF